MHHHLRYLQDIYNEYRQFLVFLLLSHFNYECEDILSRDNLRLTHLSRSFRSSWGTNKLFNSCFVVNLVILLENKYNLIKCVFFISYYKLKNLFMYLIKYIINKLYVSINIKNKLLRCLFNLSRCMSFSNAKELICRCY